MSWTEREACDYACPKCGENLDTSIDWDLIDWDILGHGYQVGSCTCGWCGARVKFVDHIRVTETEVGVEE